MRGLHRKNGALIQTPRSAQCRPGCLERTSVSELGSNDVFSSSYWYLNVIGAHNSGWGKQVCPVLFPCEFLQVTAQSDCVTHTEWKETSQIPTAL